jgi:hypothetical protein
MIMTGMGITLNFDVFAASLGGPALFLLGILGVNNAAVYFGTYLFVFVTAQRLPLSWLWCLIWLAIGISWVLFAAHVMSIT